MVRAVIWRDIIIGLIFVSENLKQKMQEKILPSLLNEQRNYPA